MSKRIEVRAEVRFIMNVPDKTALDNFEMSQIADGFVVEAVGDADISYDFEPMDKRGKQYGMAEFTYPPKPPKTRKVKVSGRR